ncbi:hypothetical protein IFR05_010507 [Cadophora sp. M221]|nr:hypothetical protein IFR05_010507 [Cadophora sp. M221]
MESINADFEEGKRLQALGLYPQAVECLTRVAESAEQPHGLNVFFALSETLLFQGLYTRALTTIDGAPSASKDYYDGFAPALQMLRCFVAAIVTAKVKASVREADRIYHELDKDMSLKVSDIPNRLQILFKSCMATDRHGDALSLARKYLSWNTTSEPTSLLRELAASPLISPLIKAKAQASIGESLESLGVFSERDIWNDEAAKLFDEAGHAHGCLDITMRKACRSAEGEEVIDKCLKKYQEMEYYAGMQSALLLLFTLVIRLNMFEVQTSLVEDLERLAHETGAILLGYMTRIQALGVFGKTLVDNGKVIIGASELYKELSNSECAFLLGEAAQLATHAYLRLKDKPAAISWAKKCQDAWKNCTLEDLSTASSLILMVTFEEPQNDSDLAEAIKTAGQLIDEDVALELAENAIDKISTVILGLTKHRHKYMNLIQTEIDRATHLCERLPSASAKSKLASICQIQAGHLLGDSKGSEDVEGEVCALDLLERAVTMYLENQQLWEAANARQACGLCYFSMYQKHFSGPLMTRAKDLDNALKQFTCAQEAFVGIDATFQIGVANYWCAFIQYEAWCYGWTSGNEVLDSILKAEAYIDRQRNEISVLQGLSAIENKQRLSTDKHTRDMYRFALQVCLKGGNTRDAWQWVQKAKARSLSDLLGLGALVPKDLLLAINRSSDAQRLFNEESKILQQTVFETTPNLKRFSLRVELDKHRMKMKEVPALRQLLEMREGVPLGLEALPKVNNQGSSSRATIFADWVIKSDEIILLTVRDGEVPVVHHLAVSVPELREWTAEFESSVGSREEIIMEMNDADNPLRAIDSLVAPLAMASSPGDLIVMCPTDMMHAIPLNALLVMNDGKETTLLERNPTLYCASVTTFAQCHNRVMNTLSQNMTARDVVAVYEPSIDEEDFDRDERDNIYSNGAVLGGQIKARNILCGDEVTPEAFKRVVSDSHLVYYHGHCDLVKDRITEQSLRLSNGKGATAEFTMKEFFDISMNSPMFMLMACNSATQQFLVGNEPLGLITSILVAGASSVIGTLWEVASETARIFAERFMNALSEAEGEGMIDLSVALQQTVISLRRDYGTRLPYHWAPFVLHGACFSRNLGI